MTDWADEIAEATYREMCFMKKTADEDVVHLAAALRKVADDYHRKGRAQGMREAADEYNNIGDLVTDSIFGSHLRAKADKIEGRT